MKEPNTDLTLRRIFENWDQIPSNPDKFNDKPRLSREEKKSLMEKVAKYNEYGKMFEMAQQIVSTTNDLTEISRLGKTYAMNECDEWFQNETLSRDFKNLDRIVQEFSKCSKECYSSIGKLRALYEDAGHVLERYYEIKDLNPTTGTTAMLPDEEAPEEEVIPNEAPAPISLAELAPKE